MSDQDQVDALTAGLNQLDSTINSDDAGLAAVIGQLKAANPSVDFSAADAALAKTQSDLVNVTTLATPVATDSGDTGSGVPDSAATADNGGVAASAPGAANDSSAANPGQTPSTPSGPNDGTSDETSAPTA